MSSYSITNDKRMHVIGFAFAVSAIIYYCIDQYILTPYKPSDNPPLDMLFLILPITVLVIANILMRIFRPIIFLYCGIHNLSGIYKGFLKSSYTNFSIEIPLEVRIRQTLFKMDIDFDTGTSSSHNKSAHLECNNEDGEITYIYHNRGWDDNHIINSHTGTAVMRINNKKVSGRYYNDPRDRDTYGLFELEFYSR